MNQLASLLTCLLLFVPRLDGWLGIHLDQRSDSPRVVEVIPESPAAKAGVKPGDRIVALDGKATTTVDAFIASVRACKVGQRVALRLERDGKELEIAVTLGERPPEGGAPASGEREEGQRPGTPPAPRAEVAPAPAAARSYLGARCADGEKGVEITRVVDDSPAAAAGLRAGDVLAGWGDQTIAKLQQLDERMQQSRPGQTVELTVRRGGATQKVKVTLGSRAGAAPAPREPRATGVPSPRTESAPAGDVELPFRTDYKAAEKEARSRKLPLFVVYGAGWDGASQAQRRALATPALQQPLAGYVCVYVDAASNRELLAAHRVLDLPAVEVRRDGELLWRHVGFLPVDDLRRALREQGGERPTPPVGPPVGAPVPVGPAPAPDRPAAPVPVSGAPAAPGVPAAPAGPDEALQRELKELRREVEELRRLLEDLRKARNGGGE